MVGTQKAHYQLSYSSLAIYRESINLLSRVHVCREVHISKPVATVSHQEFSTCSPNSSTTWSKTLPMVSQPASKSARLLHGESDQRLDDYAVTSQFVARMGNYWWFHSLLQEILELDFIVV